MCVLNIHLSVAYAYCTLINIIGLENQEEVCKCRTATLEKLSNAPEKRTCRLKMHRLTYIFVVTSHKRSRHSFLGTLRVIYRIQYDSCVRPCYLWVCLSPQAFTTLHMMYHEATACHVTGDMIEVLTMLHNLLVCSHAHLNKPGTSAELGQVVNSNTSLKTVSRQKILLCSRLFILVFVCVRVLLCIYSCIPVCGWVRVQCWSSRGVNAL